MKIIILSMFLVVCFASVTNAATGFVLEKPKQGSSLVSKNIVNSNLFSGGYQSCIDDCEAEFDYYYSFYCEGSHYDTQVCEILEDELYACYDGCY